MLKIILLQRSDFVTWPLVPNSLREGRSEAYRSTDLAILNDGEQLSIFKHRFVEGSSEWESLKGVLEPDVLKQLGVAP